MPNKKLRSNKKSAAKPKQANRNSNGTPGLGSAKQGPQMLKSEQFATYVPLNAFSVSTGSTPGGVRVRGRELLQSANSATTTLVFGSGGTTALTIPLTPTTFPRLAAYFEIYEFYKFHRAKVLFQSSQPTTTAGVAELAVDYDAKDNAPTTTVGMMRNISSSMSNVYADNACEVLGSLSRLPKYATVSDQTPDTDQTIQANIFVAFEGVVAANAPMGYILVEYDVEFFTPS